MNDAGRPVVVLVHGLWFGAWAMALLARRLRRAGYQTHYFRYHSTRGKFRDNASALRDLARVVEGPPHFVCHSMGGLVALRMLADTPEMRAGRVVLLGSPLQGSKIARRAARLPGGGRLLGAARSVLEAGFADVASDCQVGAIAGTRSFGLGWLVGGLGEAGDGTVTVAETQSDALADRVRLPVTHTGMLVSRPVAGQVVEFLRYGRFQAASAAVADSGPGGSPPLV